MRDLTPVEFRRLETSASILNDPAEQIAYQHTVFCQTCLPYKNVEGSIWERRQGAVLLSLEAGRIRKPGDAYYINISSSLWDCLRL